MKKIHKSYDGLNMNDENFNKELNFALQSINGSSDYQNDRERPYNGQPHTDHGKRGKTIVQGLTMRDIFDCFVMGYLEASGNSDKVRENKWRYNDVYNKSEFDIDPIAVGQRMMCNIEKMMKIFPNLPDEVPSVEELIDHWSEEK